MASSTLKACVALPASRRPFLECHFEVVPPKVPGCTRWRACAGVMLEMWRPPPDEPELVTWWHALVRFARRARQEQVPWFAHVDEFHLVGNIPSTRGRPLLWVYVHDRSRGELFLDDDGVAFLVTWACIFVRTPVR